MGNLKQSMNNLSIKAQAKAPTLLAFGSIAGFFLGTFLACRATWKVKDSIEECKEVCKELDNDVQNGELEVDTAKQCKKTIVTKTAISTAKEFLLPAAAMGAATFCAVKSDRIHTNRTAAATAAAATIGNMFDKYRKNVIADQGAEKDLEYRLGVKEKEIEKEVVDEKGKTKKVKEKIKTIDTSNFDDMEFCKIFDETSSHYENSSEYNMQYLISVERALNMRLKKRGYLFVNEVLEEIDLPIMAAGQYMGWLYEKDNRLNGPNSFSFNIINDINAKSINGYKPTFILNMKPDGNIYDLIFKK